MLTRYIDSNSVDALSSNLHGLDMQCADMSGAGQAPPKAQNNDRALPTKMQHATQHAACMMQRGHSHPKLALK